MPEFPTWDSEFDGLSNIFLVGTRFFSPENALKSEISQFRIPSCFERGIIDSGMHSWLPREAGLPPK